VKPTAALSTRTDPLYRPSNDTAGTGFAGGGGGGLEHPRSTAPTADGSARRIVIFIGIRKKMPWRRSAPQATRRHAWTACA
jgi:hypothetical protein